MTSKDVYSVRELNSLKICREQAAAAVQAAASELGCCLLDFQIVSQEGAIQWS